MRRSNNRQRCCPAAVDRARARCSQVCCAEGAEVFSLAACVWWLARLQDLGPHPKYVSPIQAVPAMPPPAARPRTSYGGGAAPPRPGGSKPPSSGASGQKSRPKTTVRSSGAGGSGVARLGTAPFNQVCLCGVVCVGGRGADRFAAGPCVSVWVGRAVVAETQQGAACHLLAFRTRRAFRLQVRSAALACCT